ncbi:MAG: hypothetical protein HY608_02140 [Planctomycetes bacterium]|nr:hypothetical protein [Planctomycetota bacterium]
MSAVSRLGDPDWQTREAASEEALVVVRDFGLSAAPILEAAAASADPGVAHRARILLAAAKNGVTREVYEAAFGCLLALDCASTEDWAGLYRLWMSQLQERVSPVGLDVEEWARLLQAVSERLMVYLVNRSEWGVPPGETAGTIALLLTESAANGPPETFAREVGGRSVETIHREWLLRLLDVEPPADRAQWPAWVAERLVE